MAVPSLGNGPGGFGMMAVPMVSGTANGASLAGTAADPLGLSSLYGPAMPMTPGQAGIFMLATQQRMLGLGNGQLSGVRPGSPLDAKSARPARSGTATHPVETHTRNSNIPGGQAARFFNRGGLAASKPRPFYNRQLRNFPQIGQ
jgi:hypothetical protein